MDNNDKYINLDKLGVDNKVTTIEHKVNLTDNLVFLSDFLPKILNSFFCGFVTYIITRILAEQELERFEVINLIFDILRKYYKYKQLLEKREKDFDLEQKRMFAYSYIEIYFERLNNDSHGESTGI